MERYFGAAAALPNDCVLVGSSSLAGVHVCAYRKCSGPFAQLGRFQALSLSHGHQIVARASVCSPECAAAYNRYVLSAGDPESDQARARHLLLEKVYGRRIVPAPAPGRTQDCDRMKWLRVCRAHLTVDEAELAERELVVQGLVNASIK
jgi:hypothetical protein